MHGLVIDDPRLGFSSSHFIVEHDKCERLHGHNYRVKVVIEGPVGKRGMIMDFKEAKEAVLRTCEKMDHRILIPENSTSLIISEKKGQIEVKSKDKYYLFPESDCLILPTKATTAEELSSYLYRELKKDLPDLKKLYISESEGSTAYYIE